MKRRRFMQTIAAAPALAVPAATAPAQSAASQPALEMAKLEATAADAAAEMTPRFFTAAQFAALRKLGDILMPALNGMPGASQAKAAEFLDFLLSKSPAERQRLYRMGLDSLNTQAQKRFSKSFADINETQAAELLAPLRQAWTYVPPTEPFALFLREAKADVRNATINSHEYNTANASSGRRGGGTGQYWFPLD
jgi:Gluconate 2-dehydrogenase subunit 3